MKPLRLLALASVFALVAGPVGAQSEPPAGVPVAPTLSPELLPDNPAQQLRVKELRRRVQRSISLQRWPTAIEQMKELAVLEPYNEEYQLTLGLLFRQVNNVEEARRKYQDFQDLGGNAAVAHLLMAEAYAARNQKERAFDNLRLAAENGMNILKAVESYTTLKPYRKDTEFIKLALQLETYELQLSGRHDPTTSRFRPLEADVVVVGPGKEGEDYWSREEQKLQLRKAKHHLANIERFLVLENEQKAMDSYKNLLEVTENIDRFTVPAFSAEMRRIIGKKEIIEARIEEIRLKYWFGEAKKVIAKMQREFQNEDYPEVIKLHTELEKIGKNMTSVNPDFRQVASRVTEVGENWVLKANIRREFNAMTLDIQGIITHTGAPQAIVNNRLLEVGDFYENMRIVKIEPNQIFFNFKGERIPLLFRKY